MAESKKQYFIDDDFIKEFRRIQRWIRNFRGTGVTNTPEGATVLIQFPRQPQPPDRPRDTFPVKVLGALAGAGKYYGHIYHGASDPVPVATDLTMDDLGGNEAAAGAEVVIFNALEKGTTGHWLTDPGSIPDRPISAYRHPGGAQTDEATPRPIVIIEDMGFDRDCDEEEA